MYFWIKYDSKQRFPITNRIFPSILVSKYFPINGAFPIWYIKKQIPNRGRYERIWKEFPFERKFIPYQRTTLIMKPGIAHQL